MVIIDGHVHIYDCFVLDRLFDCAHANFHRQAVKLKKENEFQGLLLLAEREGQNYFEKLKSSANSEHSELALSRWEVKQTAEPYLLKLGNGDGKELYLAMGRQFVSREGLEVLSLVTVDEGSDDLVLAEQVNKSIQNGGITVLPWAFGKWLGSRGKLLQNFLSECRDLPIFLGDNGGRTGGLYSSLLRLYSRKGGRLLISGSDPLPLPKEEQRVGSYGIYADVTLQEKGMSKWLLNMFLRQPERFHGYGGLLPLYRFICSQYLLRRGKHC